MRESCAGMAFTKSCARKFGYKQYNMSGDKSALSEELVERLRYFIEDIDAQRASRHLRKVFFDYLKFQDGLSDKDFDKILTDIERCLTCLMRSLLRRSNKNGRLLEAAICSMILFPTWGKLLHGLSVHDCKFQCGQIPAESKKASHFACNALITN